MLKKNCFQTEASRSLAHKAMSNQSSVMMIYINIKPSVNGEKEDIFPKYPLLCENKL